MTAAIVLGSILAYFVIGVLLAIHDMPQIWVRVLKEGGSYSSKRSMVQCGTTFTVLLWPIRYPLVKLFDVADRKDPAEIEKQMREQQARIDELERELRIERSS